MIRGGDVVFDREKEIFSVRMHSRSNNFCIANNEGPILFTKYSDGQMTDLDVIDENHPGFVGDVNQISKKLTDTAIHCARKIIAVEAIKIPDSVMESKIKAIIATKDQNGQKKVLFCTNIEGVFPLIESTAAIINEKISNFESKISFSKIQLVDQDNSAAKSNHHILSPAP